MRGYVDDAVLADVACVEVLLARVEIEPDVGLSAGCFGQLCDLVGFDACARETSERQTFHRAVVRRRCVSVYVSERALNAEAADFCVAAGGWRRRFLRARVVGVEDGIRD